MSYDDYQVLEFDRRDRVLTITLNRPDRLNAIDGVLHEELSRVFDELNRDRSVDVAILTGAGRAFCAGGDADWLQTLISDPLGWERLSEENRRTMCGILECRQPVIAKLNGVAAGLGATLALFCDVIFASDKAKIGDPHVKVGLVAGDGGSAIWPHLIGYALVATIAALGPAMVKLAQVLAARADLVPEPYLHALGALHDLVPPVPAKAVRRMD